MGVETAIAAALGGLAAGGAGLLAKKPKFTPPPTPTAPQAADGAAAQAGDATRRLTGMNAGLASTIKTSASGAPDSGSTVYKSLLGE